MMNHLGIYIHIPFCAHICPYCDFYSVVAQPAKRQQYIEALAQSIIRQPFGHLVVDTLYFGGGTPSLLTVAQFETIFAALQTAFTIAPQAEITLEANPEGVTLPYLTALRNIGFNRISFGVQTASKAELKALGRHHNTAQVQQVVKSAHQAGFAHISVDFMLQIPHQTRASITASLGFLSDLPVDHISAYMLALEPHVPLASSPLLQTCPNEEQQPELYLHTVAQLEAAGFLQYEISNFAKPGGESRHNLKYWQSKPYLGFGPSAHSYWDGRRFSVPADLSAFLNGTAAIAAESGGNDPAEYAMLALRLKKGLDTVLWKECFPQVTVELLLANAQPFLEQGLLQYQNNHLSMTPKGFLLSNYITGHLLF